MRRTILIMVVFQSLFFVSCDPGHSGKAYIDNKTSETLILKYQTRYADTMIIIPPLQKIDVLRFGGIGEGRMYPGSLVEFRAISLTPSDTTRIIARDITNRDNWEMVNENRRRYSGKEIICWYTILPGDIKPKIN